MSEKCQLEKDILAIDNGRFATVLQAVNVHDYCSKCDYFNKSIQDPRQGYRCHCAPGCIDATLSPNIVNYINRKLGWISHESKPAILLQLFHRIAELIDIAAESTTLERLDEFEDLHKGEFDPEIFDKVKRVLIFQYENHRAWQSRVTQYFVDDKLGSFFSSGNDGLIYGKVNEILAETTPEPRFIKEAIKHFMGITDDIVHVGKFTILIAPYYGHDYMFHYEVNEYVDNR